MTEQGAGEHAPDRTQGTTGRAVIDGIDANPGKRFRWRRRARKPANPPLHSLVRHFLGLVGADRNQHLADLHDDLRKEREPRRLALHPRHAWIEADTLIQATLHFDTGNATIKFLDDYPGFYYNLAVSDTDSTLTRETNHG